MGDDGLEGVSERSVITASIKLVRDHDLFPAAAIATERVNLQPCRDAAPAAVGRDVFVIKGYVFVLISVNVGGAIEIIQRGGTSHRNAQADSGVDSRGHMCGPPTTGQPG